jgi:hypothetical protein
MERFADVIDRVGGTEVLARLLSIKESHARVMKARNSIPPQYWPLLVSGAKGLGKDEITLEALAGIVSRQKKAPPEAAA